MIPFFILTLITTIVTLKTPTTNSLHLINQTCKNSSLSDPNINYTFCIKALNSSPSSRTATNLTRLGLISINLLKHNATNTTSFIKTLLGNPVFDKKSNVALTDCLELYLDSISTLLEAARDYRAKRYGDANVKVSSVMDDCYSCEEGFEEVKVFSPLTKHNSDAFQLSAISLSIIDLVGFYF